MLSPKQFECMNILISEPDLKMEEVAAKCGIGRSTLYRWKKNPEFKAEMEKALQERWKDSERIAIRGMIALAQNKDFKALKYILDSLGYAPAQKIDANVNQDINIVIDSEEQEK